MKGKRSVKIILLFTMFAVALFSICSVLKASAANDTDGGGVYLNGETSYEITNGKISGHSSSFNGGGIYLGNGATFVMRGGEISGNSATHGGGGVYLSDNGSNRFVMYGGTIKGNTAPNGGGVYVDEYSTFVLNGGTISGNTATEEGSAIYLFEGYLELRGGTIDGDIGGFGYIDYYDCTITNGYIFTDFITIKQAPKHDIPIKRSETPQLGDVIATLDGVQPSASILSYIKLSGLPGSYSLSFSGNDIVVSERQDISVRFVTPPNPLGKLSTTEVKVPYGTSYSVKTDVMEDTMEFSNGVKVYAIPDYNCTVSWSSSSGVVTDNMTITVTFSKPTTLFTITFDLSEESKQYKLGDISSTKISSVPYGTTYTVTDNKFTLNLPNPVTVTATPRPPSSSTTEQRIYFASWSCSQTGTIYGNTTIIASFGVYMGNSETPYTVTVSSIVNTGVESNPQIGLGLTTLKVKPLSLLMVDGTSLYDADTNEVVCTVPEARSKGLYTYNFIGWSEDGINVLRREEAMFFIMSSNSTIYALYRQSTSSAAIAKQSPQFQLSTTPFIDERRIGNFCCLEKKFDWQKMGIVHPKRQD